MKKTILAMAVLAACMSTASAQTGVTIYGIVDAGLAHVDNNNGSAGDRTSVDAGLMQTSRWGLKGVEDLGGGMKARFALEGTLLNDVGGAGVNTGTPGGTANSTALFDREATVGVSSNFGSIDIGRQNILGIGSVGLADPMGLAFAATSPNVLFGALNFGGVYGGFGTNGPGNSALRQSNSIKYVSPTMSGAGFALMRAFGEQAGGIQRGSYQGASVFFNKGPFGAAGAYARMKNNVNTDMLTSYGVGFKYTMPAAVLKVTYTGNEVDSNDRKITVLGAGVDVPVAPALTLTAAYYDTKLRGPRRDDSQQYHAIARYALSKRSSVYAAYTRANTDQVVSPLTGTAAGIAAGNINLAQGIVSVGSDSANRFVVGVMHMF